MAYETLYNIWVVLVLSLFPLVIWYLFDMKVVINRLKDKHNDLWKTLGSPGLLQNNSISNSSKMTMFLLREDYKFLNDNTLEKAGRACRNLFIVSSILAAVCFIFPIIIGRL